MSLDIIPIRSAAKLIGFNREETLGEIVRMAGVRTKVVPFNGRAKGLDARDIIAIQDGITSIRHRLAPHGAA